MIIWRISKNKYASDISGEGARLFGGRWNEAGVKMLYTSQHLSLSILEILTTIPVAMVGDDYSYLKITVPDDVSVLRIENEDLLNVWDNNYLSNYTKDVGSKWISSNASLILMVPSVIVKEEYNILINPNHIDFSKIKIESVNKLKLDKRLG